MIVADFLSEYGIRLRGWDGTWREFLTYLSGLFATNSRIARRLAPDIT